jgi:hypothetical protein
VFCIFERSEAFDKRFERLHARESIRESAAPYIQVVMLERSEGFYEVLRWQ